MPNALIAQGFQPIGRDMPQVANMLYQRQRDEQQDARRNRMLDIAEARDAQTFAMQNERFNQGNEDRAKAAEQAQIQQLYPAIKAGDPQARAIALDIIRKRSPEAATLFESNPKYMVEGIGKLLGEPGEITTQQLPGVGTAILQDGKLHKVDTPPQYGPAGYREVTIMENGKPVTYMVNERDPSQRIKIGEAPPRRTGSNPWGDDLDLGGGTGNPRLDQIIAAGVSGGPPRRSGASGAW